MFFKIKKKNKFEILKKFQFDNYVIIRKSLIFDKKALFIYIYFLYKKRRRSS